MATEPQLYLALFHGRNELGEQLDDWGFDGPIFGPVNWVHTTYGSDIKLGNANGGLIGVLSCIDELLYYDGKYYGDWSVSAESPGPSDQERLQPLVQGKAALTQDDVAVRLQLNKLQLFRLLREKNRAAQKQSLTVVENEIASLLLLTPSINSWHKAQLEEEAKTDVPSGESFPERINTSYTTRKKRIIDG